MTLSESDVPGSDGVLSEAAAHAIEALLEQSLIIPNPPKGPPAPSCRSSCDYCAGERVNVRHILFAVTQGVDVVAAAQPCRDNAVGRAPS